VKEVPVVDPLHPSAGALSPDGVLHVYTWYWPACAFAASAASARPATTAPFSVRQTISAPCRSLTRFDPPAIVSGFRSAGMCGDRCRQRWGGTGERVSQKMADRPRTVAP